MEDKDVNVSVGSTSTKTTPILKTVQTKRKRRKKAKKLTSNVDNIGGFTILGDVSHLKPQNINRILPDWLSNPHVISCDLKDDKMPVNSVKLHPQILKCLDQNMVQYFFPVQQQVIPFLLNVHNPKSFRPSDICVSAPTGSGKTLAYALPIIHILCGRLLPTVKCIVVVPTEALATQVYSVFESYSSWTSLKIFLMSKRQTFSAEADRLISSDSDGNKKTRWDIIIATPGRLVDHLSQTEGFDISQLQFLVVDEADRTLDDQEGEWLQRLEMKFWTSKPVQCKNQPWKSIPLTTYHMRIHNMAFQKLLFSATLSQNPEKLEKLHLFQPKLFTSIVKSKSESTKPETSSQNLSNSFVGKYTTPEELKESFVLCKNETKPLVLTYLISHYKWKRVLCFVNTKENTHRLCVLLRAMGHLKVREVSSKWNPSTRDLVLKKFSSGEIDILVTSDQMARGMDIPGVEYVISYDLPGYTKTYIHRIGRCARAGREGHAVSLVFRKQMGVFKKTMKEAGKDNVEMIAVKNSDLRPYEPTYVNALEELKKKVKEEEKQPEKKKRSKDEESKSENS